jgi:hypothetical protein
MLMALDRTLEDCGGPFDLTPAHTISSWETRPTTDAESTVIAFLKQQPQLYAGKRVLHIGIGNGSLPGAFANDLAAYVGLTISVPEMQLFEKRFATSKATAMLANKHDPRIHVKIDGHFDLIIDVNLKSFACCERHFDLLMDFYRDRLNPNGVLVTAESGVLFGWTGNTDVAHTPGARLDPEAARFRVLGLDGLERLSRRLGLTLTSIRSVTIPTAPANETLWLMTKA